MPILTRTSFTHSPLVFNVPSLPYRMFAGEISYSDSMTSEPTATLVYTGVSREAIAKIERAYPMGRRVTLYGVPMEVNNRSYTQDSVKVDRVGWLDSYTVTISLQFLSIFLQAKARFGSGISGRVTANQGSRPKWQEKLEELGNEADLKGFIAYSDGLRVKSLGFGKTWKFTREQVLEVGGSSVALPSEGYNKALLTWGMGNNASSNTPAPNAPLTPKKPEELTLTEGDVDPEIPPDNDVRRWISGEEQAAEAQKLRDMSSNFDQSGPTKFKRTVTTIDGTPESEKYELWGYVYRYIDIFDEDAYPRSPSEYTPADFWQLVEERETTYKYSNLDDYTNLALDITDPDEPKRKLKAIVHPDFQQFVSGGPQVSSLTIRSETQYLLETVTKGRKLTRLVQESDARNTLDPTDPWVEAELFEPTWTPYEDRTAYLLKPSRGTFTPEDEQLPFRVEFADYDSLEPRIQELVTKSVTTRSGQVAILYPDPNFVEALWIAEEGRQANSYRWAPDPEADVDIAPDPDDPPRPPEHFQTGEESETRIKRTPTEPEEGRYTETTRQYSSQDPQFVAVAEQTTFREMQGTPPSPTVRRKSFEPEEVDPKAKKPDRTTFTLVTTPDVANRYPEGEGGINIPGANTLSEAKKGLQVRLRRSGLQNTQAQYKVYGFYPRMKPGDTVAIEGDRHQSLGRWLITQLSWKLTFDGNMADLGTPTVSSDGMSLSLGLDRHRPVQYTNRSRSGSTQGGSPTVSGRVTGSSLSALGRILKPLPNRRNF
jgi:hypothetical protein